MRFPKAIRFRRVEATIYGKTVNYPFYRLTYYVAGKRHHPHFQNLYGEAKSEAEKNCPRNSGKGVLQAAALTGEQSRDALAALQRLENLRQSTGRRYSILAAVSEFVETIGRSERAQLGRGP